MKFQVYDLSHGDGGRETVFETDRLSVMLELPGVDKFLQIRLEDGVVQLMGSGGLVIRPHTSNVVHIEVEQ